MAIGDVIVLIKEITKEAGVAINQQDSFSDMPATATNVSVQLILKNTSGSDVVYDAVCTGIAAS